MIKRIVLIVLIILCLISHKAYGQVGTSDEIRYTIGYSDLLNNPLTSVRVEYESPFNHASYHRVTVGAEVYSDLSFQLSMGYGYHIPYMIGNAHLSIQPSINVGVVFVNLEEYASAKGFNHFLELRHHIVLGDFQHRSWGLYMKNRLITSPGLQVQLGPDYVIPYYQFDNAIGVFFKW